MKMSQHIRTRCRQRGIPESDLELVVQHGTVTSDGLILTGKDIADAVREMKRKMKRLSKLKDVLILTDDVTMVTVYRADRRRRRIQTGIW